MPDISFFKIFMIFGIVSAWAKKALEDNRITLTEAADLGEQLGELLGIPTDVHIPFPTTPQLGPSPDEETEAAAAETKEVKPAAQPRYD